MQSREADTPPFSTMDYPFRSDYVEQSQPQKLAGALLNSCLGR